MALKMTFIDPQGKAHEVEALEGWTVLDIGRKNGFDLEGACEGAMACSTCHVIVAAEWFDRLPEASEEEEDMLDLAAGVVRTSRLSCQIDLADGMDGLAIRIPSESHDMRRF